MSGLSEVLGGFCQRLIGLRRKTNINTTSTQAPGQDTPRCDSRWAPHFLQWGRACGRVGNRGNSGTHSVARASSRERNSHRVPGAHQGPGAHSGSQRSPSALQVAAARSLVSVVRRGTRGAVTGACGVRVPGLDTPSSIHIIVSHTHTHIYPISLSRQPQTRECTPAGTLCQELRQQCCY